MAASGDEFFSDDSLEVVKKPNRKLKPKKIETKKKQSYLQLYQHRLASEFRKLGVSNDNVCHPTRSNSQASEPKESNPLKSISQPALSGPSAPKIWSEFVARKYKEQRSKSDADKKAEMLKKRLEYGKRMTQLNKFNIKFMSAEPVKSALKPKKSEESVKMIEKPPAEAEKAPVAVESSRLVEIDKKLSLLKRRHLSDKKITEKIKAELKIVVE